MNEAWKELKQACAQCHRCSLGETRHSLVFGDGAENARIMLIGEGPGEQEDRQGVPFVGPAGKLLDDMLEMIYLDRTKVYIANIVKCRPPHNRDPLPEEQEACIGWLRRQVALVHPKIIVCLGRIAAMRQLDEESGDSSLDLRELLEDDIRRSKHYILKMKFRRALSGVGFCTLIAGLGGFLIYIIMQTL